jgi:hypothetical protein
MQIWLPVIIATAVTTAALILEVYILRHAWVAESRRKDLLRNFSASLFTVLYLLILLDVAFGSFLVRSDGYGFTLASRRWNQRYWNPINSQGYRDREHDWKGKILLILGDSFAAGYGIEQIADRFAGVLAQKLGDGWTVAVLAKNGWGPVEEYQALPRHAQKPTRIIVSYYLNDIEDAASENGFPRPDLIQGPSAMVAPFVNYSFSLNWFYWRLYRGGFGTTYWDYLRHAYDDGTIWETHERELLDLVNYARRIDAEIAFIVWPNLQDIDGSAEFTSKVVGFLEGHGVKAIDLAKYFAGRPSGSLVVNSMDQHPNLRAHAEVAQLLYESLSPWR